MFIEHIRLINDTEVPEYLLATLENFLKELYESDRALLLELREKCRNPAYQLPKDGEVRKKLEEQWLILRDGSVQKDTQNVVLAMCQGEMSEMRLVSPTSKD